AVTLDSGPALCGGGGSTELEEKESDMRSNRSVAALSACSLILAAGAAASAAGVNWDGNWDGNVVRAPDARVIGQRVIPVEGSSATVMSGTEVGADGASQPNFAISLDGATVAAVRQADYTVHLNYAAFDPKQFVPAVDPAVRAPAGHDAYLVQ